jgi:hypothetical protein
MTYGTQQRLLQIAFVLRSALATLCRRNSLFKFKSYDSFSEPVKKGDLAKGWELFVEQEVRRRIAYFTFVRGSEFYIQTESLTKDDLGNRQSICTLL